MQFLRLLIIGLFGWTVVLLGAEWTLRTSTDHQNSLALWEMRQKLVLPDPHTLWTWRTSNQLSPAESTMLPISWTSSPDGTKPASPPTQLASYGKAQQVIVMGDDSVWGLGQQTGLTLVDYLQMQFGPASETGVELINAARPYGCPTSCQIFFRQWLSQQTSKQSRIVLLVLSPEMLQAHQKVRQQFRYNKQKTLTDCGPLPKQIPIPDPPEQLQQWLVYHWLRSEVEDRFWNTLLPEDSLDLASSPTTTEGSVYNWATPLVPSIEDFALELQQHGIPLVVAMPPGIAQESDLTPEQSHQYWQGLHSQKNVSLIPLYPDSQTEDLVKASANWWNPNGLLSEFGHQEIAHLLISPLQVALDQLPSKPSVTNLANTPEEQPTQPSPPASIIR